MEETWGLEEEFWAAGVTGDVPRYLARVLTADAFVVLPGVVLTREQLLREWEARPLWSSYALGSRRGVLINQETAVLSYRVEATDADGVGYRARVSSVYTWVGAWALAMRQHTPEPGSDLKLYREP
ncbi:nuclear transport factor 2 family protein [Spongisporangium articulatum]|uniref:Nuclear transport factor 2 family protein n=1 Tax=Spongisporangium articulatum TaxID=3362603 RepID=A0ABW8AM26_9ACTN